MPKDKGSIFVQPWTAEPLNPERLPSVFAAFNIHNHTHDSENVADPADDVAHSYPFFMTNSSQLLFNGSQMEIKGLFYNFLDTMARMRYNSAIKGSKGEKWAIFHPDNWKP